MSWSRSVRAVRKFQCRWLIAMSCGVASVVGAQTLPLALADDTLTPSASAKHIAPAIEASVIQAGQARGWILQPATIPIQGSLAQLSQPLRVTVNPLGTEPPKSVLVWIESGAANAKLRMPLQVAVKVFERVWVAQSDVPAGVKITSDLYRVETREVAHWQRRALRELDNSPNLESRTELRAGQTIYQDQVALVPTFRKSQTAWIGLQVGRVLVQRQGRVEHDARPGQSVRVQFADTVHSDAALIGHNGQLELVQ